jgi:hypothetical protein
VVINITSDNNGLQLKKLHRKGINDNVTGTLWYFQMKLEKEKVLVPGINLEKIFFKSNLFYKRNIT